MADHNNGSALFVNLPSKDLTDVSSGFGVQGSRRLVCEKDGRIPSKSARDRNALFFTGAERVRLLMKLVTKVELKEQVSRHFPPSRGGRIANLETERHIV